MRFFALFLSLMLPAAALAAGPKDAGLDGLFRELKAAPSAEAAKPVEERIIARFRISGSPSTDLLVSRAEALYESGDRYRAKRLIGAATNLNPGFAEGWHVRALMLANDGDDQEAMVALQKAIAANPRHFAAMVRLGDMLEEYGDKEGALKLFRRALALDPQYEGLKKRVEALSRSVEGEGI